MPDPNLSDALVAKIDAFASSLEPEEQAMLIGLLTTGDDVAGFGGFAPAGAPRPSWPGLMKLGVGQVAGTAGSTGDGLIAHELTHVSQQRAGDTND
jgi:hypothetical protein